MGMFDFLKKKDSSKEVPKANADSMPKMPELPDIPTDNSLSQNDSAPSLPELPTDDSNKPAESAPTLPDVPASLDDLHKEKPTQDLPSIHGEEDTNPMPEMNSPTEHLESDSFDLPSFNNNQEEPKLEAETSNDDSFDFSLDESLQDNPGENTSNDDLDLPTSFDDIEEPKQMSFEEETPEMNSVFAEPPTFSEDDEDTIEEEIPEGPHYLNLELFENVLETIGDIKSDTETTLGLAEDLNNTDSKLGKAYEELQSTLITVNKKLQTIDKTLFK